MAVGGILTRLAVIRLAGDEQTQHQNQPQHYSLLEAADHIERAGDRKRADLVVDGCEGGAAGHTGFYGVDDDGAKDS